MRVLITRPQDDSGSHAGHIPDSAAHTAHDLAAYGIDACFAPLFDLELLHPDIPHQPYQAVIFTSRHSARHFCAQYHTLCTEHASKPDAFCVGTETAAALDPALFGTICSADADAIALRALINRTITNKALPLLRVHADLPEDLLADGLTDDGFTVIRAALYHMKKRNTLGQEAENELRQNALSGVCLYSPNAARHFSDLVTSAGLAEACRPLVAWCISDNTRHAAASLPFASFIVADTPTHKDMIRSIAAYHTHTRA